MEISRDDQVQNWHSELLSVSDCIKDEESTWFGLWCCWILNARNVQIFNLGDSFKESCIFWVSLMSLVIVFRISIGFSILYGIILYGFLAWRRAKFRTEIRQKMSIPGTFSNDLVAHSCLSCCAVCQEAREAKTAHLTPIDYCFGEPLLIREEAHDQAIGATPYAIEEGTLISHLKSLSKTSKFIILLWAIAGVVTIIVDIIYNHSSNLFVLLLIFIQPILILYFLYWRSRRQYAYFDYVVKTFAYGFWFATCQAIVLESILQGVLAIIMTPFLPPLESLIDETEDETKAFVRSHLIAVIFTCIFMAYIIAAGCEETVKHFVVRCCQFPSPLKDPHSILVYLLSGALGFATSENIQYVFSSEGESPVPGVSLLGGELIVLLIRVATPIHAICAVLQAANLSKVMIGHQNLNLFQILLPALIVHGTFDFVMFLLAAFGYAYDLPDSIFEVTSIVFGISMTIISTVWAYIAFKRVENDYRDGWRMMPDEESPPFNPMIRPPS